MERDWRGRMTIGCPSASAAIPAIGLNSIKGQDGIDGRGRGGASFGDEGGFPLWWAHQGRECPQQPCVASPGGSPPAVPWPRPQASSLPVPPELPPQSSPTCGNLRTTSFPPCHAQGVAHTCQTGSGGVKGTAGREERERGRGEGMGRCRRGARGGGAVQCRREGSVASIRMQAFESSCTLGSGSRAVSIPAASCAQVPPRGPPAPPVRKSCLLLPRRRSAPASSGMCRGQRCLLSPWPRQQRRPSPAAPQPRLPQMKTPLPWPLSL